MQLGDDLSDGTMQLTHHLTYRWFLEVDEADDIDQAQVIQIIESLQPVRCLGGSRQVGIADALVEVLDDLVDVEDEVLLVLILILLVDVHLPVQLLDLVVKESRPLKFFVLDSLHD